MRPLLILDLDETLIHAVEAPLDHDASFRCGQYHVYERPFAREFCQACTRDYDLAVWTSSTAGYAQCVVEHVADGAPVAFLWTRDQCTRRHDPETQEYYWVKDLKKVKRAGYDLKRVLFVDDTRQKLERNYGNLILVSEYTGDRDDRELVQLSGYLAGIAGVEDFRALEKRAWRRDQRSSSAYGR
jgi:hypothetical protein